MNRKAVGTVYLNFMCYVTSSLIKMQVNTTKIKTNMEIKQ